MSHFPSAGSAKRNRKISLRQKGIGSIRRLEATMLWSFLTDLMRSEKTSDHLIMKRELDTWNCLFFHRFALIQSTNWWETSQYRRLDQDLSQVEVDPLNQGSSMIL